MDQKLFSKYLHILWVFISAFLILQLTPGTGYSQKKVIYGKVTDKVIGDELVGVNILLEDTSGTITDLSGKYRIEAKPGKHKITFFYLGYKDFVADVTIKADSVFLSVAMEPSAELISDIVVSAGRFEQKLSDVTVSMAIIKPKAIENTHTNNMESVIGRTPGIDIMDDQPSIRGGSGYSYGAGSRVLVMVDDLPIITPDLGDTKWNFLPTENISQLEIVKGASSALFGSSALNGVINVRTAYAKNEPETKIILRGGVFMEPKRKELIWWEDKEPPYSMGLSLLHSRKIGNMEVVAGGNLFNDSGYRKDNYEKRGRGNVNLKYTSKKIKGLSYGVNTNYMWQDKGEFFLWQNADSGAYLQNQDALNSSQGARFNMDPFINYLTRNNNGHKLRTRYYRTTNFVDDAPEKNSYADLIYGDYQYQQYIGKESKWTTGACFAYGESSAQLFGDHYSNNFSLYSQIDKKINQLKVSLGGRLEYYRIDTAETVSNYDLIISDANYKLPFYPVFRMGLNYTLTESTFLRTSYGQGYRFPTIAEKFISTSVGGMTIFSNPRLQPEKGWSSELAVMQGLKFGMWQGFIDVAGFWTEYEDMMEFTFGFHPPDSIDILRTEDLGFKSMNVGKARIYGVDITLSGEGKVCGLPVTLIAGYTYTYPKEMNSDSAYQVGKSPQSEILKYRSLHTAKVDVEVEIKKIRIGTQLKYISKMVAVDAAFENPILPKDQTSKILPGYKEYREENNNGYFLMDFRVGYNFTQKAVVSLMVNNLLNVEYMGRPGDIRPHRNLSLQLLYKF